jgi:hypothetical protein
VCFCYDASASAIGGWYNKESVHTSCEACLQCTDNSTEYHYYQINPQYKTKHQPSNYEVFGKPYTQGLK